MLLKLVSQLTGPTEMVRDSKIHLVDPSGWFRRISEEFIWVENSDDFIEQMKLEMFQDKVFCFTPKGEVVKLPRGATPLDFAYTIHTSIGDNCVGSEVDGVKVPLWTRLRNGQSVKIVTASGQKPSASWEEMVVTGRELRLQYEKV